MRENTMCGLNEKRRALPNHNNTNNVSGEIWILKFFAIILVNVATIVYSKLRDAVATFNNPFIQNTMGELHIYTARRKISNYRESKAVNDTV